MKNRAPEPLKEWHKTVLLLVLLALGILFIVWTKAEYGNNFLETL